MGKANRGARKQLEERYGKGCMFIKGDIEEKTKRKLKKTYKVFKEERHYTAKEKKALESLMTYHHLKHKANGGKATVENGAIVNALAHQYIHSLSRQDEEIINNELRNYKAQKDRMKLNYIEFSTEGTKKIGQITFDDLGVDYITIQLEDDRELYQREEVPQPVLSEEEQKQYEEYLRQRRKETYKKFKYNEALDTNKQRKKAEIDEEWQKEIILDVIDEQRY